MMKGEEEEEGEGTEELLDEVLDVETAIVNLHKRCEKRLKGSKGEGDEVLLYLLSTLKEKAVEVGSLVNRRIRQRRARAKKDKSKDSSTPKPRVDEGMEVDRGDKDEEEDKPVRKIHPSQIKYEWTPLREFKDFEEAMEYIQGLTTYAKGSFKRVGKRWNKRWYTCKMKGCPRRLLIVQDDEERNGGGIVKMCSNGRDHVGHVVEEEGPISSSCRPTARTAQQKVQNEDNESFEHEEDDEEDQEEGEEAEGTVNEEDTDEDRVVKNHGSSRSQTNEWHPLERFEGLKGLEQAQEYIKGLNTFFPGAKKKVENRWVKTWHYCKKKLSKKCPSKLLLVVDEKEDGNVIAKVYGNGKRHLGHDPQEGTDTPTSTPTPKRPAPSKKAQQEEELEDDNESEQGEDDNKESEMDMEFTDGEDEDEGAKRRRADIHSDEDEDDGIKSFRNGKYEWHFLKEFGGLKEAREYIKETKTYHCGAMKRVRNRWNKTWYHCREKGCPNRMLLVEDDKEGKREGVVKMYLNERGHVGHQVTDEEGKGTPRPSTSTSTSVQQEEADDNHDDTEDCEMEAVNQGNNGDNKEVEELSGTDEEDESESDDAVVHSTPSGNMKYEWVPHPRKFGNLEDALDYILETNTYYRQHTKKVKEWDKMWYTCKEKGCPHRMILGFHEKKNKVRMYTNGMEHLCHQFMTQEEKATSPSTSTSRSHQEKETGTRDDDPEEDCEMEGVNQENNDDNKGAEERSGTDELDEDQSESESEDVEATPRGTKYDWKPHPTKFKKLEDALNYINETDAYFRHHTNKISKWERMWYSCKDRTCPSKLVLSVHEKKIKVRLYTNGVEHLCHKLMEEGTEPPISSAPQQQEEDNDQDPEDEDPVLQTFGGRIHQWQFQRTFRNLNEAKQHIHSSNIHQHHYRTSRVGKDWNKMWHYCKTDRCPSGLMLAQSTKEEETEVRMYKNKQKHVGHEVLEEEENSVSEDEEVLTRGNIYDWVPHPLKFRKLEDAVSYIKEMNTHYRQFTRKVEEWDKTYYYCKDSRQCPNRLILAVHVTKGKVRLFTNGEEHACDKLIEKEKMARTSSGSGPQQQEEDGDDDDSESDSVENDDHGEGDGKESAEEMDKEDDEQEDMESDDDQDQDEDPFLKSCNRKQQWEFQRKFQNLEKAKEHIKRSKIYHFKRQKAAKEWIKTWYYCRIRGCPSRLFLAKSRDEEKEEVRMYRNDEEHEHVGLKVLGEEEESKPPKLTCEHEVHVHKVQDNESRKKLIDKDCRVLVSRLHLLDSKDCNDKMMDTAEEIDPPPPSLVTYDDDMINDPQSKNEDGSYQSVRGNDEKGDLTETIEKDDGHLNLAELEESPENPVGTGLEPEDDDPYSCDDEEGILFEISESEEQEEESSPSPPLLTKEDCHDQDQEGLSLSGGADADQLVDKGGELTGTKKNTSNATPHFNKMELETSSSSSRDDSSPPPLLTKECDAGDEDVVSDQEQTRDEVRETVTSTNLDKSGNNDKGPQICNENSTDSSPSQEIAYSAGEEEELQEKGRLRVEDDEPKEEDDMAMFDDSEEDKMEEEQEEEICISLGGLIDGLEDDQEESDVINMPPVKKRKISTSTSLYSESATMMGLNWEHDEWNEKEDHIEDNSNKKKLDPSKSTTPAGSDADDLKSTQGWKTIKIFPRLKDGKFYLMKEFPFYAWNQTLEDKDGVKMYYSCRRGEGCPSQLYIESNNDRLTTLRISEETHNHEEKIEFNQGVLHDGGIKGNNGMAINRETDKLRHPPHDVDIFHEDEDGERANQSLSFANPPRLPYQIFKCSYCPDRSYLLLKDFSRHLQEEHGIEGASYLNEDLKESPFQCYYCPKSFTQKYSADNHIQKVHPRVLGGGRVLVVGGVLGKKLTATPTPSDTGPLQNSSVPRNPPSFHPKGSRYNWVLHSTFPTSGEAHKYIKDLDTFTRKGCRYTDELRKLWYLCRDQNCPSRLLLIIPAKEGDERESCLYDNGEDHNHTVPSNTSGTAKASSATMGSGASKSGGQQEMFYSMDGVDDTNEDGTTMYVIEDEEMEETTPPHPLANLDLDYEMVEGEEEEEQDMMDNETVYVLADEDKNGGGKDGGLIAAGGDEADLQGEAEEGAVFCY